MNFRFFLVVFLFFIYSCKNKFEEHRINKNNLEKKIEQAFLELESSDISTTSISVLFFIDKNNIVIKDSCVLSKVYALKALKGFLFSDSEQIFKNATKGLEVGKNCSDIYLKASLNNLIGIQYDFNSKYELAIKYYKKAIGYGEKYSNKQEVIDSYYNITSLFVKKKKWKEVVYYSKRGIPIIEKSIKNKRILKFFYTNIALAYTNLGNFKLAKKYRSKSIVKIKQTRIDANFEEDNINALRIIDLSIAKLNEKQKKYDVALKYMKASDSLLELLIKFKNKKTNEILRIEAILEKELITKNNKIITEQRIIEISSILFLLISFYFLNKIYKFSNKLKITLTKIEGLNTELINNVVELEKVNAALHSKKREINTLLKYSEQSLFTKTLKISTYKDALNNVIKKINRLIENKESIKSIEMHSINRGLQQLIDEKEIWKDFKIYFEKNRPNFFDKLLEKNSSLSVTEQKHCAYVAISLKSKEVASILNLSPRSVETARYRIHKKLELKKESLHSFLEKL